MHIFPLISIFTLVNEWMRPWGVFLGVINYPFDFLSLLMHGARNNDTALCLFCRKWDPNQLAMVTEWAVPDSYVKAFNEEKKGSTESTRLLVVAQVRHALIIMIATQQLLPLKQSLSLHTHAHTPSSSTMAHWAVISLKRNYSIQHKYSVPLSYLLLINAL